LEIRFSQVYETMHKGLWEKLVALDPEVTARRTMCEYISDSDYYAVVLLGRTYMVDRSEQRILPAADARQEQEANFLEQLCILAYLINAREVPLANKLVAAEQLEGGQFFFRGIHALPTDKLSEAFCENQPLLHRAADQLGGSRCEYGDASIELSVLPRFAVTFIVWRSDAEFAGRASILFDQSADQQLPLDAILAAANLAVEAVINTAAQGS
jgi:hypothetical protein